MRILPPRRHECWYVGCCCIQHKIISLTCGWKGISPRSFQARKDLYGEDVRSFRPERWLEDEKQARLLQKWAATFGGGSTHCVGKLVASLIVCDNGANTKTHQKHGRCRDEQDLGSSKCYTMSCRMQRDVSETRADVRPCPAFSAIHRRHSEPFATYQAYLVLGSRIFGPHGQLSASER